MIQVEHAVQGPPTGASGHKVPYLDVANTWSAAQVISAPVAGPVLTITTPDPGATGTWLDMFTDSASPAAFDTVALIRFAGRNSTGGFTQYATIFNILVDPTAGNETSYLWFGTTLNGAQGNRMILGQGLYTFNAAGGDKGPDTINATTLYEAGVSIATKYAGLGNANTWTANQVISPPAVGVPLTIISTLAGTLLSLQSSNAGTNAGPLIDLFRDKTGPAANDSIGQIEFSGRNSAASVKNYAGIVGKILSPTAGAESSAVSIYAWTAGVVNTLFFGAGLYTSGVSGGDKGANTINATTLYEAGVSIATKYAGLGNANTWTAAQIFDSGSIAPITVRWTDGTQFVGPDLKITRASPTPAASDFIGRVLFEGFNASLATISYSSVQAQITDPTVGSESATLYFNTYAGGSGATRLTMTLGVFVGAATGGDMGANTINANFLYEAGVALTAKYGQLAVNNSWTGIQTFTGSNISTPQLTITNTDPGGFVSPILQLNRNSASPAANDFLGKVDFYGNNSSIVATEYAYAVAQLADPTAGSEDAHLRYYNYANGAISNILGLYSPGIMELYLRDDGATVNPWFNLYRYSATPAASDNMGAISFLGPHNPDYYEYVRLQPFVNDPTVAAEVASFSVLVRTLGTLYSTFIVRGDGASYFQWNDAGSGVGPDVNSWRGSASPAANDFLGRFTMQGLNSGASGRVYGTMGSVILDPTAGSEDSYIYFSNWIAGAYATRVSIGAGLYTAAVSGGDKGADTINATTLYEAGVALTAKYGQLAANNVWTGTQQINSTIVNTVLSMSTTDAGAAGGPTMTLDRASASPAVNDVLGVINFFGRDSTNVVTGYSQIFGYIVDPTDTSEDSGLYLYTYQAGALIQNLVLSNGNAQVQSVDQGANGFPLFDLSRGTSSPAAGDNFGTHRWLIPNTSATVIAAINLVGYFDDPTAGSEDARFLFQTYVAGANGNRVFIGAGLYVPGVADPGVGNIHGVTLWENGGPIAARYIPGGRNLARRNGQFLVWQRGAGGSAVIAVPASTIAYTADGWYLATNALQACTVTQAGPLGLWASQFSAKVQRNAGQTGVAPMRFGFPLDTDELWQGLGELVRLSYTVVAGANYSPASGLFSAVLYTGTGAPVKFAAGFTGGVQLLTQNSNITTTATRYSATAPSVIASNSRQVEIDFIWTPVGTAGADDSFTVTDVMLEVVKDQNQVSSPMERLLFSDAQQLCMRHYQKTHAYSIAPGSIGPPTGELHFQAGITGAVTGYYAFKPPVWMRAGPTVVIQNPDVANNQIRNASLALDFTGSALVYGLGNEILISGVGTAGATVPNLIRFNLTLDASI